MNRIMIPLVLVLILFGVGGYYFINNQKGNGPVAIPSGGVCDKDTMTCSDGTVLHRTGLSCDFPPCPSGSDNSTSATTMPSPTPIPSATGEDISISGTMICLPHRNINGPQTLECAFGLKGDDGNNYGLTDPGWKFLMGIGTDTEVRIQGKLNKKQDEKYDSVGVITIESLVRSEK